MRIHLTLILMAVLNYAYSYDSRCSLKNGLKTLAFFVSENQAIGSTVGTIEIFGDPGKSILLKFEHNNSPITIVPFTKTIQLRKQLDKENETGLSLVTVNLLCERLSLYNIYKENIEPFSIPITVHVIDENDNAPQFNFEPIVFNISESTRIGAQLRPPISASDKDKSEKYSRIRFSIIPSFYSDFVKFENDLDGVLYLSKKLDYETVNNFSVYVQASDEGDPPQVTETKVYINVIDSDDNNPKFISDTFHAFLPRNGTTFNRGLIINLIPNGNVQAVDQDSGINSAVNYYFNSNDYYYQFFTIDKISGIIRLKKNLPVQEISQPITLIVRASQVDNPDKFALCKVIVSLLGNVVKFLKKIHQAAVPEDLAPGSSLLTLQLNQPLNSNLKFFISEANLVDLLSVGSRGDLILNQPLDYETVDFYKFKVFVTDGHFNDTTNIEIQVLNVNDWEPRFRYPVYEFYINALDYTSSFGRIEVADGDKNDSLTLLLNGRNASLFVINSRGDLSLKPNIRTNELRGECIFTVTATDSGGKKSSVPVIVHFLPTSKRNWNEIKSSNSSASALIIILFVLLALFTLILTMFITYLFTIRNRKSKSSEKSDNENEDESQVNNPVFNTTTEPQEIVTVNPEPSQEIPSSFYNETIKNIITKSAKRYQAPSPPSSSNAIVKLPEVSNKKHENFWSYSQNFNKKTSWSGESQYRTDCEHTETMNRIETINVNSTKRRPINENLTVYF